MNLLKWGTKGKTKEAYTFMKMFTQLLNKRIKHWCEVDDDVKDDKERRRYWWFKMLKTMSIKMGKE